MAVKEIKAEDYSIQYDGDAGTINFQGEISLGGPSDYNAINELLNEAVDSNHETLTLDLRDLAFLNSSGISMLSKFVVGLRKKKGLQLIIIGSNSMPWQGKSLTNLKKLLPGLTLDLE